MTRTAHDILGVPPGASKETIQRAYRRKVKKAHPDTGGDVQTFDELHKAYIALTRDPFDIDVDVSLMECLAHFFREYVMKNVNIDMKASNVDVVSLMRRAMENEIKTSKQNMNNMSKMIKFFDNIIANLSDDTNNFLSDIIRGQRMDVVRSNDNIKIKLDILLLAY